MKKLQPEFDRLVEEESRLNTDIRILEQRCRELYAKQGHREQFKTVEERNRHLERELLWINGQVLDTEQQIKDIEESNRNDEEKRRQLEEEFQVGKGKNFSSLIYIPKFFLSIPAFATYIFFAGAIPEKNFGRE